VHDLCNNDYVEEDSVERHVHLVVHQISQQACVRIIRVGTVVSGNRGMMGFGLGVGFGPAVLAAVAGLAVDGREVHVLG